MKKVRKELRNVAIIAHVDHGKTTLVDAMFRQGGIYEAHQAQVERAMDSGDIERERGITILAKNTAIRVGDVTVQLVDTPGHADFGGEVERSLFMVDGVLLLVDAAEGPQPQTRFVLLKAMALGLPAVVVLNKIDRPDARAAEVVNLVYDLFIDLGANDGQLGFPIVYTNARAGTASFDPASPGKDLAPLFGAILTHLPPPEDASDGPLQVSTNFLDADPYLGRLSVGRIRSGRLRVGQRIAVVKEEAGAPSVAEEVRITALYTFSGLKRTPIDSARAGEIVAIAGPATTDIGDTLADPVLPGEAPRALARIVVDPPTLSTTFGIATSPFVGQEARWMTSRHIRDRLVKEAETNVAIRIESGGATDYTKVYGRGELQLAVLMETMRREGYAFSVGVPEVVLKDVGGVKHEPVERVAIDCPDEHWGIVAQILGMRRGKLLSMAGAGTGRVQAEYLVPTRGLLGFRGTILTATRGTAVMSAVVEGYEPWSGEIATRRTGALISDRPGRTTPYAIFHLQSRGEFFVGTGVEVFAGQIVGENAKESDLYINAVREKRLTNIRSAGRDENTILTTPRTLTLELALEFINPDEMIEVTPAAIRLAKRAPDKSRFNTDD